MDFYEVLEKRRSIRKYKNDPVTDESLEKISRAIQCAPSACNLQPCSFRIITDSALKEKIYQCYPREWLRSAPAIVVALGNEKEAWTRPNGTSIIDVDMGIAMEHLVLAATAEGLATCWICAFQTEKMNQELNIMPPWSVIAISPLGYANEEPAPVKRKPVKELIKTI